MAEVLGLVASGISVAQVAGSILTSSLKLKALLDKVKDAPDNLKDLLDHLELLTPIISGATTLDEGDAAGNAPARLISPAPRVQQALQRVVGSGQNAAEQLELLVTELVSKIGTARSGMRLKRAMVKVVLKKSALAKYESRLQKTIQILTLAQTTYLMEMQRTQSETIMSQVKLALTRLTPAVHENVEILGEDSCCKHQILTKTTARTTSTKHNTGAWRQYLHLGFANVTGLFRVQTPCNSEDHQTTTLEQGRLLRIQVQMPTWLCASIFDATLSSCYAGWTYSLQVYANILDDSEEYDLVREAISSDSVDALYRLFEETRCSPLDRVVSRDRWKSTDHSLLEVRHLEPLVTDATLHNLLQMGSLVSSLMMKKWASRRDAWKAARYLLNHGAEYDEYFIYSGGRNSIIQIDPHFEDVLKHDMLSDPVVISFLACCPDDVTLFTGLVGRVWPFDAFYDAALEEERLDLAMRLVSELKNWERMPSPAIFRHLCGSLSLEIADEDCTTMSLSYLAEALGYIVWCDPVSRGNWYRAIWDTVLRLNKEYLMPDQHTYEWGDTREYHFAKVFDIATPFTDLFLESLIACPSNYQVGKRAKKHKITSRLANCEKAIHMWLDILQDCGVDLLEYGRQAKQILTDQSNGYNFRIFRDVWFDQYVKTRNGLFEIRLISFKYGSQLEEWKLWWSEPTDELVGDFWREMEPEELWIPGSWGED